MATCEACHTTPAVVVEGYEPKGRWEQVGAWRVYVTGPETAKKAIVDIYDIFGAASQTIQGADILAGLTGAVVLVPDWFGEGGEMNNEWFKNPSPENEAKKNEFYKKNMVFDKNVLNLTTFMTAAKGKWNAVEGWGALGLCWGGKVAALASGPGTEFKVTGQVHPGRLATEDAKKIAIPHIVLASDGEDAKIVQEYREVLVGEGKPGVVDLYQGMHHGWMGARAALGDEVKRGEYLRGYKQISEYFGRYL